MNTRDLKLYFVMMQQQQRQVFDRCIIDGYRTSKTESIAMTARGRRMFVGTSDGMLLLYECRPDTVGTTSSTVE